MIYYYIRHQRKTSSMKSIKNFRVICFGQDIDSFVFFRAHNCFVYVYIYFCSLQIFIYNCPIITKANGIIQWAPCFTKESNKQTNCVLLHLLGVQSILSLRFFLRNCYTRERREFDEVLTVCKCNKLCVQIFTND